MHNIQKDTQNIYLKKQNLIKENEPEVRVEVTLLTRKIMVF